MGFTSDFAEQDLRYLRPRHQGPVLLLRLVVHFMSSMSAPIVRVILPAWVGRHPLEGVFITHFHSDHIDGLGELMTLRWAGGSFESPLPVYGPSGIERVVNGFNEAYAQDFIYRQAHHGDTVAPLTAAGGTAKPFLKPAPGQTATLVDEDGLKIEAFSVTHSPVEPAVGYRFTYKGRTRGDLRRYDQRSKHRRYVARS